MRYLPIQSHKIIAVNQGFPWKNTARVSSVPNFACAQEARLIIVTYQYGRMKEEQVQYDKRRGCAVPSVCNFGIRIRCVLVGKHVYDVKVNHRLPIL